MTHLVLAGHGSHLNAASSEPFHRLAAALRASGEFDAVSLALWKEEPSLARALDAVDDPDVVVVPIFISNGYFTRTVVPREMRLDGPLTERNGQRIRCTPPVGTHPRLAGVIIERAREAGAGPADALVVLGHGTRRDSESEKNVYAMAELAAQRGLFAECGVAFIDQEPGMLTMLDRFRAPRLFVVPLFIAEGWHVGETIPADLALDGPETRRGGRAVHYTPPVGTHPALAAVVAELAREALARFPAPSSRLPLPAPRFPLPASLGELRIDPGRVCGPGEPACELPPDAEAIRRRVRFDAAGRYRPLSGARSLPPGWFVPLDGRIAAEDVVEAVYPLALVHRAQAEAGTLRVVPLDQALDRQSGRYEPARQLSERGREVIRGVLCGGCVRTPAWPLTASQLPAPNSQLPSPNSQLPSPGAIPCPEPCSVFVALAREAAAWERQPPDPAPPDPAVPIADFEAPGNEVREAVLAALRESVHPGAAP
ncbi:DR2241 family protein [Tepidiforma flava]|uniref:DR2241 family protein n=1 Tax=Tepidiforma flava TaxID=3004094 RepID=A0ABY7M8F9_9CHLR|nr:CbiX/SirB N-terminal domain-containing protein [Tepidiforma flava]WBL36794.1 DR2241 family protein [Tepidiforma flava]